MHTIVPVALVMIDDSELNAIGCQVAQTLQERYLLAKTST